MTMCQKKVAVARKEGRNEGGREGGTGMRGPDAMNEEYITRLPGLNLLKNFGNFGEIHRRDSGP